MVEGFVTRDLENLERQLLDIAQREMPRECRKFLNKEGMNLKKRTVVIANLNVNKITGEYLKSIKKDRTVKKGTQLRTRVYTESPHGHLIENGHRQVVNPKDQNGKIIPGKGIGREVGFVRGRYVFADAAALYKNEHFANAEKFVDELLRQGLF